MLMMGDPHVHFHVFPRYEGERTARAMTFADASWPGPPELSKARKPSGDQIEGMRDWLSGLWPAQSSPSATHLAVSFLAVSPTFGKSTSAHIGSAAGRGRGCQAVK